MTRNEHGFLMFVNISDKSCCFCLVILNSLREFSMITIIYFHSGFNIYCHNMWLVSISDSVITYKEKTSIL